MAQQEVISDQEFWRREREEMGYEYDYCAVCGQQHLKYYLTIKEDNNYYCSRCEFMPPYSDRLFNALLAFQRLFRSYMERKGRECPSCHKMVLHLHDFRADTGPICHNCVEDILDEERVAQECPGCSDYPCRCAEDEGWCSRCKSTYWCVCGETDSEYDGYRCYCGDSDCFGGCGVLRCGCIDVCRGRCGADLYD